MFHKKHLIPMWNLNGQSAISHKIQKVPVEDGFSRYNNEEYLYIIIIENNNTFLLASIDLFFQW